MIKRRGTQKVNTCFCPYILSEQFTCVPLTFYQKWNMQKAKNKQKMPLYGRSRGGPKGPTAIWKMGIFFLNKYIHKILILQLWKAKNKVGNFFFIIAVNLRKGFMSLQETILTTQNAHKRKNKPPLDFFLYSFSKKNEWCTQFFVIHHYSTTNVCDQH